MSLNATGNLNPGRLDRRITLRYASAMRDANGGTVVEWVNIATVWAAKQTNGGGRLYAAEAKNYDASLTYVIRHRSDVSAGWRVAHGDDVFEVTAVTELGREHYLQLELRAVNQTVGYSYDVRLLHDGTPRLLHDDSNRLLHAA